MCPVYFFCVLAIWFCAGPAFAADDGYWEELVAQGRERGLHSAREWAILLHYRQRGNSAESLIDDPRFFLAPSGKTSPAAELAATIRGFFAPAELGDEHPRCRFPARFLWLKEALAIDEGRLPSPVCGKLDETLEAVAPSSATLVFPMGHLNDPASMFGHTLLRIGGSYKSDLMSYAANYSARNIQDGGLTYAFKGVFGMYRGYYSLLPYYEKVKEYSDMDHRDMWEYPLNFSAAEARRMVLHLWELKDIYSDYFFFDENCSFNLLFILEAGRPSLNLTREYWDRWSFWVVPADTIATIRRAGLIDGISYRPAQATRIHHRAGLLSPAAQGLALDVALQRRPASAEAGPGAAIEERRQVLELAAEFLQYRYSRDELTQPEFQAQFLPILKARSALGAGAVVEVPPPPQPEEGHPSGRLTTGAGVRRDRPYLELDWQPAYHDLLDPDAGYTAGAQVKFLAASGRYYPEEGRIQLQSFHPVDIVSLSPRDRFFRPVSWKVVGGLDRKPFADGEDRLFFRLNTGGGLAWELPIKGIGYVMAEADLNLADRFERKAALGGGASAGLLATLTDRWKAHLAGSGLLYVIEGHQHYRLLLDQHLKVSRNTGVLLHTGWERSFGHDRAEAGAGWVWYF
jgi:Domain of unknown function (DUF4105)